MQKLEFNMDEKLYIYLYKSIAILSVICAHVHISNINKSPYIHIDKLFTTLGIIGVGMFFVYLNIYFVNQGKK